MVGAHGDDGRLRIAPESDNPARYNPGSVLSIAGTRYTVLSVSNAGKTLLIALDGVSGRTDAESLAGEFVTVDARDVPPLPQGAYYHFQLIDLVVKDTANRRLGVLVEVIETGANDVYRVVGDEGEWLLPALKATIIAVDLQQGEMMVEPPEGLEAKPIGGGSKRRRRARR